ncbi:MAG: SDR family oxidoreductase [Clostridia bacterium]|nr:SDR family oxidoreductase [Clostridia bacterium]
MMLRDKVSLVTGAAGGIGRQIALTLAKEGSKVAIVDIKEKEGEETVREINSISEGMFIKADISRVANIEDVVQEVYRKYGRIDILVNNAGISIRAAVDELTEEEWDRINTINLKAAYFFSKEVCRIMKNQRWGRIVNIASIRGLVADETHTAYSITKAGMLAMTRSFAFNLAQYNINVNAVSPGYVLTPMTEHNLARPGWLDWLRSRVPLGRLIEMQEVADAVLFLVSDKATGITGHNIVIDGGWTIHE